MKTGPFHVDKYEGMCGCVHMYTRVAKQVKHLWESTHWQGLLQARKRERESERVKSRHRKRGQERDGEREGYTREQSVENGGLANRRVRGENPGGSQSINSLTSSPTKRPTTTIATITIATTLLYSPALASAYPS